MDNKYFIAIAKEKYDCWPQDMEYLGIYDCFSLALEQIVNHNKKYYFFGCREFNYFIFVSKINEKVKMEEKDCIYSLTSDMQEKEHVEYIAEEYKHYLNNKLE